METKNIYKEEKRSIPRVSTDSKVSIQGEICGVVEDLNEKGIRFLSDKYVDEKQYSIGIKFPGRTINAKICICWSREDDNLSELLTGAKFTLIDEEDAKYIRKYMIQRQYRRVAKLVKDRGIRREILKFAKEFTQFLFRLESLNKALCENKIKKEELQIAFRKQTDSIIAQGDKLNQAINDKQIEREIKNIFRETVGSWIYKSKVVKHGFDKPRGYPGDFEMLDFIYDKRTLSDDNQLGYYFDMCFLESTYAEAVRNRKDRLRQKIKSILGGKSNALSILNLACGPCREWRDLLAKGDTVLSQKKVKLHLLDWEEDALSFVQEELKELPDNIEALFLKENILNVIRNGDLYEKYGQMDMIYSIGLADYFTDRILKNMIRNSFAGLRKGGQFIIAHKDREMPFSHLPPEWYCDWVFVQRNEEELLNLIEEAGLGDFKYEVEREDTKHIFFVTLTKI